MARRDSAFGLTGSPDAQPRQWYRRVMLTVEAPRGDVVQEEMGS
jgi:hypothetical protein